MNKKRRCFFIIILGALLLPAAVWGNSIWQRIYCSLIPANEHSLFFPEPKAKITNILIIGLDEDGGNGRADTIMVMSINEATGQAAVISVPRDARVEVPGRGPDKLNHVMTNKGAIALMKQTVEQLFGVNVDYYISTDFGGFTKIIDLLGGVTLDVEKRMIHQSVNRPPINLYPGLQRLDGKQALGYVRYRGDASGDFARMQRQQKFLKAFATEALQMQTVLKLPRLLEEAARHVRTNIPLSQVLAFGRLAAGLDPAAVSTMTLQGRGVTIGGVSYIALDEAQLDETVRRYLRWEKEEAPALEHNREAGTQKKRPESRS